MKKSLINLFKTKKDKINTPKTSISSLAPKILTKKEDIAKIQPYLNKLKDTIDTKGVNNIALTGGYGSGKSTIINTFKSLNTEYEYLNISLASFNKKKEDKNDQLTLEQRKLQREELERLLEVSILQQIFYHVKPTEIPESRFKRIINIPNWKLWLISIGFILWVTSSVLLLKYDYLDNINPAQWNTKDSFDWFSLFVFLIVFTGLGIFSKLVVKLFSNSQINKVNIKGELELGNNVNKSVFNEHLEEILYFFERTDFNVIIIEDLDRFDSTDIFTKLREINILLNNTQLIKQEVNFVYAVGDALFNDKKERVKFFEYIIPVIPFINSSNAEEQLKTLIKESDLEDDVFSKEFLSDITTFIDDIDMRLLINIFHEFAIYRSVLKPDLIKGSEAELFAMITYKNLDPKDYDALNSKKGKLYVLLNNKKLYTKEFIDKINEDINLKKQQIENINNENLLDLKDIRRIYANQVLTKIPNTFPVQFSKFKIEDLSDEDSFNDRIVNEDISYIQLTSNGGYNSNYYSSTTVNLKFSFEEIEKEVNPDFTYEERVELIESKHNNRIEVLQIEIEKLKKKKSEIEHWDLKQIFKELGVSQYLKDFTNSGLLRNLLLEGYINENYNDYISLFHEISLTKEDKKFERNVKSGVSESFNYKLIHIENLVDSHLDLKYFERETILNFDLLDFLGKNYTNYSKQYDAIIKQLSNEKQRSIQFIENYIEDENRPLKIFIEKLVQNWKGFWEYIYLKSNFTNEKEDHYLSLIIRYGKIDDILFKQNNNLLTTAAMQKPHFLSIVKNTEQLNYFSKITKFIEQLNIKFEKLDNPTEETKELFDFIYNNNNYEINKENLLQKLKIYGENLNNLDFETSNYLTIQTSNCEPLINYINSEINIYVEKVYLKIEQNKLEDEGSLVELINNIDLDIKLKKKIIQKIETKINNLNEIEDKEIKTVLLTQNVVVPTWDNVINYYVDCEEKIDEILVEYLNFKNVYLELASEKMLKESATFDYAKFRENLLLTKELSDECYTKILESSIYMRNSLTFEKLNETKVKYLTDKVLTTTKTNYDLLRSKFPNNHVKLIEKDFSKFYDNIDDFETNNEDIKSILKSTVISNKNKHKYISKLDENTIKENVEISKIIGEIIIQETDIIDLGIDSLNSIVSSLSSKENKVRFVNLYLSKITNEELVILVKNIGWFYGELFKKQHKPKFDNTDYNNELLGHLKSKRLINSFEVYKKDNTLIKAVANY